MFVFQTNDFAVSGDDVQGVSSVDGLVGNSSDNDDIPSTNNKVSKIQNIHLSINDSSICKML